jgi:hypothetical protein
MTDTSEQDKMAFERTKLRAESVKHIMTLATGTAVLTVTLLDKLPKPISGRFWLLCSIASMLRCLLSSFGYMWASGILSDEVQPPKRFLTSIALALGFEFVLGVWSLGIFALYNLSQAK